MLKLVIGAISDQYHNPLSKWRALSVYWKRSPVAMMRETNFSFWRVYWFFAGRKWQNQTPIYQLPRRSTVGAFDYFLSLPFKLIFALLISVPSLLFMAGVAMCAGGFELMKRASNYMVVSFNPIVFLVGNALLILLPLAAIIAGGVIAAATLLALTLTMAVDQAVMLLIERAVQPLMGMVASLVFSPVTLIDWLINKDKQKSPVQDQTPMRGSTHDIYSKVPPSQDGQGVQQRNNFENESNAPSIDGEDDRNKKYLSDLGKTAATQTHDDLSELKYNYGYL